jgi:lipoprotein-anchoring transpeptidase ErfK/SrfK
VSPGEKWIDVDLTKQRVHAFKGKNLINSFITSTGTWQYPTVTGQYKIYVMYRYADMAGPGYYLPNVPFVMYFHKGYGIHGTYWHNNFGTPMSHGCVNLKTDDAGWVYNWVSIGTVVNIHY